jgi:hypothetical protein
VGENENEYFLDRQFVFWTKPFFMMRGSNGIGAIMGAGSIWPLIGVGNWHYILLNKLF